MFLRLLPNNSRTAEGKRHVTTVPVKLARSTNDLHKEHSDAKFCKATINFWEEICSVLGPSEVLFISQDDQVIGTFIFGYKYSYSAQWTSMEIIFLILTRVPIGKTAANKQSPLLMHLDYRVRLPHHDWVVADKHKLIPSVIRDN